MPTVTRFLLTASFLVLSFTFLAPPLLGQTEPSEVDSSNTITGTITGTVTDAVTQAPLQGATIRVIGTSLGAITSKSGRFTINSVAAGVRVLRIGV